MNAEKAAEIFAALKENGEAIRGFLESLGYTGIDITYHARDGHDKDAPMRGASMQIYCPIHLSIAPGTPRETAEPAAENIPRELLGLTLGELVSRYGSLSGIERYMRILKDLVITEGKFRALDQKNSEFPGAPPPR